MRMEMQENKIKHKEEHKINGLFVLEYGENNSQAVIFIHAFPLCDRMWDSQVKEFEKDYKVIVYDLYVLKIANSDKFFTSRCNKRTTD